MDPYRAWDELMELLDDQPMDLDECERASEIVEALLSWTSKGGFMPDGVGVGRASMGFILVALLERLRGLAVKLRAAEEFVVPSDGVCVQSGDEVALSFGEGVFDE